MGLCINEENTKLIVPRRNADQSSLKVGSMSFKRVDNFKYLGVKYNMGHMWRAAGDVLKNVLTTKIN